MTVICTEWHNYSILGLIKLKFKKCPLLSLTEMNVDLLLFLLLKSSQFSFTIQCPKEVNRYNVVTMGTKMDFQFSMKMVHFAEKIIPDVRNGRFLYARPTYFTFFFYPESRAALCLYKIVTPE